MNERVLEALARDDVARRESSLASVAANVAARADLVQPLHVVYGGAHLFEAETVQKVGALARRSFQTYAPDAETFAEALGLRAMLDVDARADVHARVGRKLVAAPVEDYRIDFEDGYGLRGDADEDAHVDAAARALAEAAHAGLLCPRVGFRIKALAPETRHRALRTLETFLVATVQHARGLDPRRAPLPAGFVVTLPKVVRALEVEVLATLLDEHEGALGLARGVIAIELMIEHPAALLDEETGRCAIPSLVRAARGRCSALHLGSYDFTASLGIAAHEQRLAHPSCDFAKHVMQLATAGSGIALSDGATTTMPIEPHRTERDEGQRAANHAAVKTAWRLHADNVRHGLAQGFYQGWDLHPAQIPARYGAVFAFFREAAPAMETRLASFLSRAARASRVGQAFDDAATGQGLLNFFDRAVTAGALDPSVLGRLGIGSGELRRRSFADMAAARERVAPTQ